MHQQRRADDRVAAASASAFAAETERINSLPGQLDATNRRAALLLAVEAHRRDPSPQSLGALQQALVGSGSLLGYFGGGIRYETVEWIDDERVAAVSADGIDVFTIGAPTPTFVPVRGVQAVAPSPAGDAVAVVKDGGVSLVPLDGSLTRLLHRPEGDDVAQSVTFAPDGRSIAIGTQQGELVVVDAIDGTVERHIARVSLGAQR